jgi:DNA-binding protein H-NS
MAKNLSEYLTEMLNEDKIDQLEKKLEKVEKKADDAQKEAEKSAPTIKDEQSFREYAENKFKKVFGDKLDEDKMNGIVNGILQKYKDAADNGEWGKLVGILNKSF